MTTHSQSPVLHGEPPESTRSISVAPGSTQPSTIVSQPFRSRLFALLLGVPVFIKVIGIALGTALLLGTGMLWQIHRTWRAHVVAELDRRGHQALAQVAAHCAEFLREGRSSSLSAELRHCLQESPEIVYLVLQEANGVVLAESCLPGYAPGPSSRGVREIVQSVSGGFGETALPREERVIRAGLSTDRVDEEVAWLLRRVARTTGAIAVLGILGAWALSRIFAHPIEELAALARAVKAGDYHARAPIRASDEIGELAQTFNEMTGELAKKEAARQLLMRKVIQAGEEERKRIARELHDQTGQALTSQLAALSLLESKATDPECRRGLALVRRQVEQTLADVHHLSVTLRPSVLDDVGLMAALRRHCRLFGQQVGVETTCVDLDLGDQRLPQEVELTIYRLVQEALTNAIRHGGSDRLLAVVQRTPGGVRAMVRDHGCGFDPTDWQKRCLAGNHLGLLGLEERVTLIGGAFCVDSVPGKGTLVFADIPIKA